MNDSDYMKGLWSRIATGKIGNQGQGYLDTGWLDSAFGGADARKNLMYKQIGNQMQDTNRRLDLADKRLGYDAQRYNTRYGLVKDRVDSESNDALWGDVITGASIPLGYIQGQNEAKAIDEDRARQERMNKRWDSVLGKYEAMLGSKT